MREALEMPAGPLTANVLATLEELVASNLNIADLRGIEYLHNLIFLNLSDNRITDLSPLAGLTWLQFLVVDRNQITDLSPLNQLDLLEILLLDQNQNTDLSPLLSLATSGVIERIDVVDADGQNPVNITFSPGDDWAISWSPR